MPDLLFEATLAWRYLPGARGQGAFSLLTVHVHWITYKLKLRFLATIGLPRTRFHDQFRGPSPKSWERAGGGGGGRREEGPMRRNRRQLQTLHSRISEEPEFCIITAQTAADIRKSKPGFDDSCTF